MKSLFTAIAILLSVATLGQSIRNIEIKTDSVLRINVSPKEMKWLSVSPSCYNLTIESVNQLQRRNDTLTIYDKAIRFIVIDGVLYEVLRSTEVKKVEVSGFLLRSGTYPPGITLTPGYQIFPGPNFKAN
ncbi:hypothetical protein IQ13_3197 [Lacibacter cauensis]|uniref:Uncharacterized protein n=1 Tax=Lacibacter cauensis TaxID=510947 RepID=A0A562SGW9_9BACT|nr:hypothetical protein [Lacibacter cauensis]TWI80519.1 hypothetical protein IQ13_3197 [Lacibacter cauensis]